MNLQAAKTMLIDDQLDWNKPHLRWIPAWNYRLFRQVSGRRLRNLRRRR